MKLFYHPCGPLMTYHDGLLKISDLNPEIATKWTMTRWEMIRMGWRCIVAACRS